MALTLSTSSDEAIAKLAVPEEKKKSFETLMKSFWDDYQAWYSEASLVVKQLLPDRLEEFVSCYRYDPKRKKIGSESYKIQDWMTGTVAAVDYKGDKHFQDGAIVSGLFKAQTDILKSCKLRFESTLADIQQLIQADIFDSEIDAAMELHKKGFLRAGGAICGVILEKHLQQVAKDHQLTIRKKNPTISDLNDPLKQADVYDVPVWRNIQRLADVRNLCDHNKEREPSKDEVLELIEGTSKICKTIY